MTSNEKNIFTLIATDEMNQLNGGRPRTIEESATYIFTDQLADDSGLTMPQVKAILANLVKKELIEIDDDEDESSVQLTKLGIAEIWS